MSTIGLPELIVIAMILILVFGASRLPKIGEGLGRAVRNLKRGFEQDARIEIQSGTAPKPRVDKPAQSADGEHAPRAGGSSDDATDAEIVEETKREPTPRS